MAKSTNPERLQRILDAAANLFVHYGYDKTAVSDIARDAGVSQGAIYLHFDSKEALFEGLFIREMKVFAAQWLDRIDADPEGGTMAGMYKNMLYALSSSAFMSAIFRRDRRVLGNYVRKPGNIFKQGGASLSPRHEFIRLMQEAGAVRQDIDAGVIAHIMNILAYGIVGMDEVIPEAEIPPLDNLIEGIAQIMDRALTPEGGGNSKAGKAIIRQIMETSRQQFEQQEEESES